MEQSLELRTRGLLHRQMKFITVKGNENNLKLQLNSSPLVQFSVICFVSETELLWICISSYYFILSQLWATPNGSGSQPILTGGVFFFTPQRPIQIIF